jgi:hypothetical protein
MVSFSLPKYRYAVNANDAITSVSPLWLAFARENGASQLTCEAVMGRSLWDFIDGVETTRLYKAIVQRVRTSILRVMVPFRCDSPTLRRYMRLEITRQPEGSVQFDGVLERVEPTTRLNLLDPAFPRSRATLTLCSCCKRALVEPYGWLEIEDVAVRLHLLEEKNAPQLRSAVCPECLAAAYVSPTPLNGGHSANSVA